MYRSPGGTVVPPEQAHRRGYRECATDWADGGRDGVGAGLRGIVLTTAEVASEGLDAVLDNIARTGATALATTLGILVPGQAGDGTREPPLDVTGQARLLDRPLWGRRELYVKGFAAHEADPAIWADVAYPPPPVAPPEHREDMARQVIDGARARGLAAHIQISPYTLPGAPGGQSIASGHGRGVASDRPLRIDGGVGELIVAGHGCLNNPRVRALGRARLREVAHHYPDAEGIFLDWAEYTCYFLEDCFACFCPHCRAAATAAGYDWARVEADTRALWDRLHRLSAADLRRAADPADWPFALAGGLLAYPGVADLLRLKAATVVSAVAELRATLDRAGGGNVALEVNGFAPPWSAITGMDYGAIGAVAQATRCKLFTFHWPMIARWWSESLLAWNPGLDETAVLRAVTAALDLPAPAGEQRRALGDYGMPRPDQPHPITMAALTRKLAQAVALAGTGAPCQAYLHSYRPAGEFAAVLDAARVSAAQGCWVQRYSYLSDEKLAVLREAWGG